MISSKAIDLVKTFSEDEFREFGLFVSSPYFNRENIQVKFYDLLKKYYPSFENRNFEKEKVFAKLYPGKKYNDGVMRNILSGTLELARNFITIQNLQHQKFNYTLAMMRELGTRKMDKLFEKSEAEAEDILANTTAKNEQFYYDNFRLAGEKMNFEAQHKSALYTPKEILSKREENLTISFLITMLSSQTSLANSNHKMFSFEGNSSLDELEAYIDKEIRKYAGITYFQYYYNAYKLARTQDEKYFYKLKQIMEKSFREFREQDKRDIFTILTNYCYFKINMGDLNFKKEHFLLFRENIERGHYKGSRKYLDHIQYLNVIVTGLDAGETAWVEDFIEKYKKELDEVNRENSYNFACSLVYYHRKQYSEALDRAAKVKTDDLSYKHQLKSLYLKIYFDMNETEPFYSHVDSYKHFLMNEKHIPSATKDVIWSYVNFTKKLFDIKNLTAERDFDLVKIRKEILAGRSMINKQWLLDRISSVEKEQTAA